MLFNLSMFWQNSYLNLVLKIASEAKEEIKKNVFSIKNRRAAAT